MKASTAAVFALVLLSACAPGSGSAEDRAAKAAALGVELSDFEGAEPVLLSLAQRNDVLLAALSLRRDYPKASKRQIQFEVATTGMSCVTAFADAEPSFDSKLKQFNERFARRTMQMGTAGNAEFDAFAEAVKTLRRARLENLVDIATLIPADTQAKLAEGEPGTAKTPSLAECKLLFSRMSSGRFDS